MLLDWVATHKVVAVVAGNTAICINGLVKAFELLQKNKKINQMKKFRRLHQLESDSCIGHIVDMTS